MNYKLAPINFERLPNNHFVSNIAGEHIFLPQDVFSMFIQNALNESNHYYYDLKAKHMLLDGSFDNDVIDMLAVKYRTKKRFLN
ncbi:MAG: His-Xaa-Ser system radical SAM maturase HxsB, partial [Candidatus Margulisbacteria bacterium]|nr:His-Xaa-Ser system radical SAM maturase HxsB [Candidatus Margulisiibacteriota bacterium]